MNSNRQQPAKPVPMARATRVAILTNIIPPYQRPVLVRLAKLYPALRILVSTPMEPNRSWAVDWEGLDVVVQKTITLRGVWRHPRGFKEPLFIHIPTDTVAQLKRFQTDAVLSAEMGARTLLSLVYRKLSRNSKLIVWADISEFSEQGRGRLRRALRLMLARQADAFIVYGNSGARYLRSLNVPDAKIFIAPFSTDVDRFAGNPLNRTAQEAYRLLYVGQLIERKGLGLFIEVLTKWAMSHPERVMQFSVAGDGPLRKKLERLSVPKNLEIELLGNVAYEDIPRVYAQSGIFVFPTLADTWGLVVNEAMASGLPILGSVYSQAVEMLVVDDHNGWTFRPDDAEETYRAIDRCMNTPSDLLDRMRERARTAATELTPEHVARLLDEAVTACLMKDVSAQRVCHVC